MPRWSRAPAPPGPLLPSPPSPPRPPCRRSRRALFAEAQRIATRAASASTRRQYAAIFRAFGDWLASELGRPPVVGDLDAGHDAPGPPPLLKRIAEDQQPPPADDL